MSISGVKMPEGAFTRKIVKNFESCKKLWKIYRDWDRNWNTECDDYKDMFKNKPIKKYELLMLKVIIKVIR